MNSHPRAAVLFMVGFVSSAVADDDFGIVAPPQSVAVGTATATPAWLRLGADALVRLDSASSFDVSTQGLAPGSTRRALSRVRPTITLTPHEDVRFVAQAQWYGSAGDVSGSDVTAYILQLEIERPRATLRLGRQELVYGSAFLLGADTFYDGSTFDGARLGLRPAGQVSLDLFAARYVPGNSADVRGELYGAYATWTRSEALGVDLYAIVDTADPDLGAQPGASRTNSFGVRLAGAAGPLAFEFEPVWQTGRKGFADRAAATRAAHGGHVHLAYVLGESRLQPEFSVGYAWGSGDADPDDGRFTNFSNPNQDTAITGDIGLIGDLAGYSAGDCAASGLRAWSLGVALQTGARSSLAVVGHGYRAADAPASRELGYEVDAVFAFRVRNQLTLLASANRFAGGDALRGVDGRRPAVSYAYIALEVGF